VVVVDEPAAGGVSLDRVALPDRDDFPNVVRCPLVQRAVWPMRVVVLDVLAKETSELGLVPDDGPVQQFRDAVSEPSVRRTHSPAATLAGFE